MSAEGEYNKMIGSIEPVVPFVRVNNAGVVFATIVPEDMEKIADLVVKKLKEDNGRRGRQGA